jgi:hypothetical protein
MSRATKPRSLRRRFGRCDDALRNWMLTKPGNGGAFGARASIKLRGPHLRSGDGLTRLRRGRRLRREQAAFATAAAGAEQI